LSDVHRSLKLSCVCSNKEWGWMGMQLFCWSEMWSADWGMVLLCIAVYGVCEGETLLSKTDQACSYGQSLENIVQWLSRTYCGWQLRGTLETHWKTS
jgi:hypothetical protein